MHLRSFQLAHVMWPAWGYTAEAAAAASPLPLVLRCLAQALATGFHRFLARFSGRRRYRYRYHRKYPPPWAFLVLVLTSSLFSIVDACSSRTTPKPRPPAPTARPNITFHTYECPPAYAAWYCLNGATCFTVKIGDSLLYNCECADGYMGPRCEYKDLDGSYLPSQRRFMLETASIAGGATIAVFLVVILCVVMYLHYKRRTKSTRTLGGGLGGSNSSSDCVDGSSLRPSIRASSLNAPTFGTRWRTERLTPMPSSPLTTQGSEWLRPPSSATALHQVAAGGDSSAITKERPGLSWNMIRTPQQQQTQTSQQQRYTPGGVVQNQPRQQQPQQVLISSTNRDVYSA